MENEYLYDDSHHLDQFPIDFDNLPESPDFSEEQEMVFQFAKQEVPSSKNIMKSTNFENCIKGADTMELCEKAQKNVDVDCSAQNCNESTTADKPLPFAIKIPEEEKTPVPSNKEIIDESSSVNSQTLRKSSKSIAQSETTVRKFKRGKSIKKFKRWDRDDDKKLFRKLREFEKKLLQGHEEKDTNACPVQPGETSDLSQHGSKKLSTVKNFGATILDEIFNESKAIFVEELEAIMKEVGWRAPYDAFIARIQTLRSRDFSCRELKQLKKLVKQRKYKIADYEQILFEFPGKSMTRLKEV